MSLPATGAAETKPNAVRRLLTWPVFAVSVLVADSAFLRWVGVPFWVQLSFGVFLAACVGTGALFLSRRHAAFPDHASFALAALAGGLALHMALCFVGLHEVVQENLHLGGERGLMRTAFAAACPSFGSSAK